MRKHAVITDGGQPIGRGVGPVLEARDVMQVLRNDPHAPADLREKAREEAMKRLEEESKKPNSERRPPEFGSDKDFQLEQAIKRLKGQPVLASKTQTERAAEKKDQ